MNHNRTDSGSVAAFAVLFSLAVALLLGLVAEGGQVMTAREIAISQAEQAARAGAEQLGASSVHAGALIDSGDTPIEAAQFVLASFGRRGSVEVSGTTVEVHITAFSIGTPVLGIVGVPSMTIDASASARAVAG